MKKAVLKSQIQNGFYNTKVTEEGEYNNELDGEGYSINSLWVMVRSAESRDSELMQSARKSLEFYKNAYEKDNSLYLSYDENGNAISEDQSPWVYALVGRAAIQLKDADFSDKMLRELFKFQVMDKDSRLNGAFAEGSAELPYAGQFTIQETILTLQTYLSEVTANK